MRRTILGMVGTTAEDRAYRGSRFSEVQEGPVRKSLSGRLGCSWRAATAYLQSHLDERAARHSSSRPAAMCFAKSRSGPSIPERTCVGVRTTEGFRRLLHPNGICFTGTSKITEDTHYSGYFRKGSQACYGRYSTCCSETRRGHIGRYPWSVSFFRRPTRIMPNRFTRRISSPSKIWAESTPTT